MKSGYDECVRINRFFFRIMGVWPDSKSSAFSRFLLSTWVFVMIFFVNAPQTAKLTICGDFNNAVEILTTADIIIGLSCLKLVKIWLKKEGNHLLTIPKPTK